MGTPAAKKVKASKAGNTGRSLSERDAFTPRVTPTPDPRLSRSFEYSVAILECFTGERQTLGIAEMADMMGVSRSTAHRYALTLVALGRLEQDDKRKYRLAPNAAEPGMAVIGRMRLESPGPTILEDLREETGHTVSMGLLDGTTAIYMYRLFAHGTGQYEADGNLGVGARVPVHSTAIGRALLASLPEAELDKLLREMRLEPSATNRVRTKGPLARVIEQFRHDEIAFSDEEHAKGARSLAVPITGRSGKRRLAVEVTAPADDYTLQELLARCGPPLKHAAKRT
jgi:IclR family transcriptional regulator, pca regulon regulatory protein